MLPSRPASLPLYGAMTGVRARAVVCAWPSWQRSSIWSADPAPPQRMRPSTTIAASFRSSSTTASTSCRARRPVLDLTGGVRAPDGDAGRGRLPHDLDRAVRALRRRRRCGAAGPADPDHVRRRARRQLPGRRRNPRAIRDARDDVRDHRERGRRQARLSELAAAACDGGRRALGPTGARARWPRADPHRSRRPDRSLLREPGLPEPAPERRSPTSSAASAPTSSPAAA